LPAACAVGTRDKALSEAPNDRSELKTLHAAMTVVCTRADFDAVGIGSQHQMACAGQQVAVKVQRPSALATISKDLYVMRRGVGVYEAIVTRFTAQTTDYQRLVSTFAEGLYTEMDFRNEALNMTAMAAKFADFPHGSPPIIIPEPVMELTSRRVLTMEWVPGVKLTTLPQEEVRSLVKIGQEAFLIQLLEIGALSAAPTA
jgi:aarF domain-containing kinase